MPVPETILYLTEADVQKTLTVDEAVDLAGRGIEADAAGKVAGASCRCRSCGRPPSASSPATRSSMTARPPGPSCCFLTRRQDFQSA